MAETSETVPSRTHTQYSHVVAVLRIYLRDYYSIYHVQKHEFYYELMIYEDEDDYEDSVEVTPLIRYWTKVETNLPDHQIHNTPTGSTAAQLAWPRTRLDVTPAHLSSDGKLNLEQGILSCYRGKVKVLPETMRMGFDTILLPQVKNAIYGMTSLNISCCRNVTDDAFRHFTNLQSLHTGMPR